MFLCLVSLHVKPRVSASYMCVKFRNESVNVKKKVTFKQRVQKKKSVFDSLDAFF